METFQNQIDPISLLAQSGWLVGRIGKVYFASSIWIEGEDGREMQTWEGLWLEAVFILHIVHIPILC